MLWFTHTQLFKTFLFCPFFFLTFKALNNDEEVFQSLSWKADGTVLVTTSKDKKVRIWDPRANSVSHSADSHSSNRESVTTWLGSSNRILTSGFDSVSNIKREKKTFKFHRMVSRLLRTSFFLIVLTESTAPGLRQGCAQLFSSGILSSLR